MNAETQTSLYLDSSDQTPTDTRRRLCLSAVAAAGLGSSFGLAGCASPQLALEWRDEAVKPVTASKIIILAQHPDVVIERVCEDLMSEAIGKAGVAAVAGWRLLPERSGPPDEQSLQLAVTQSKASHVLLIQTLPPQQSSQLAPITHTGLGYWGPYRRWYGYGRSRFYGGTVWAQVPVTTITTSASLYEAGSKRMLWGASHVSSNTYNLRPDLEGMVAAFLQGLRSRQWLPPAA